MSDNKGFTHKKSLFLLHFSDYVITLLRLFFCHKNLVGTDDGNFWLKFEPRSNFLPLFRTRMCLFKLGIALGSTAKIILKFEFHLKLNRIQKLTLKN